MEPFEPEGEPKFLGSEVHDCRRTWHQISMLVRMGSLGDALNVLHLYEAERKKSGSKMSMRTLE